MIEHNKFTVHQVIANYIDDNNGVYPEAIYCSYEAALDISASEDSMYSAEKGLMLLTPIGLLPIIVTESRIGTTAGCL